MDIVYIAERGGKHPKRWRVILAQWLRIAALKLDGAFCICAYGTEEEERPKMAALVAQAFGWHRAGAAQAGAELEQIVADHREQSSGR